MSDWIPSTTLAPGIELLVRRWGLPAGRIPDVQALLREQDAAGTACRLPPHAPDDPDAWGTACHFASEEVPFPPDGRPRPLVLQRHQGHLHLQAWRFFQAERDIARRLMARARQAAPPLTRPAAALLADLGPGEVNARQAQAITCALEHSLALITGGPGTGKTHTLARLLALLIAATPDRPPLVHLAAPTGKAAERMREAVETAASHLPPTIPDPIRHGLQRAAAGASTLHRLLGFNPSTGRCRHGPDEPLRSDIVIVDECSMMDTLLWQALLAALPPRTRLVLVGDPHQLESVSAGDVLGSLVRFAKADRSSDLARVWVELTESHRFRHRPGIGQLASAIVNLDSPAALQLLASHTAPAGADDGLVWLGDHEGRVSWDRLPSAVQAGITAVADATEPRAALAALARIRLLSAHREHALGVAGLNETLRRHLAARAGPDRASNEPIIVNVNDPETGLTNGSVGIVMTVGGARSAYFPAASPAGEPRKVSLGQLPDHSPAWALTIHRSQGSEFEQVVVILPPGESPLATRELLYTAITRAKDCVHVWGGEEMIRSALGDRALRCTLLEAGLRAAR